MTDTPTPTTKVRILGYGLVVLLPVIFITVLESVGYCYLRAQGADTYRFFLKRNGQTMAGVLDTRTVFSHLDPHLSHAQDPAAMRAAGFDTIPGFAVFGEQGDTSAFTIAVLGGSTTDPLAGRTTDPPTGMPWTQYFAEHLAAEGYVARVLNGGVSGYSSAQELFKLIRDVVPLEPDLVLSLNGINDLGFLHGTRNHPMVHPYQKKVLDSLTGTSASPYAILPNALNAALRFLNFPPEVGLSLGTIDQRPDHGVWRSNVRTMHAVCTEFTIPYVCFLQPTLGVGAYVMSDEERAMLGHAQHDRAPYRDYGKDITDFYTVAQQTATELPYVIDLTDVFDGEKGMYRDARHQTPAGGEVLAEAIFELCKRQGLLPAPPK